MEVNRFLIFIISIGLLSNAFSDWCYKEQLDELEKEVVELKASSACSS